jgi:flagellin
MNLALLAGSGNNLAFSDLKALIDSPVTMLSGGKQNFTDFVNSVLTENPSTDTGAIGGSYASGGTAMSDVNVVQGNNSFNTQPLLAAYGWTVEWPTSLGTVAEITGSALAVAASRSGTLQAVDGTLLLHSAVAGFAGRISISGDENIINALGFAEIQSAKDTVYDVSIVDAHSGKLIKSGVRVSGGAIYGELHESIDIRLTNNFALDADDAGMKLNGYGTFDFTANGRDSFIVHIAADSTVFQIGANEGENIFVSFGDVSQAALGVDAVSVRDRELASRAVTIIDNAISKVSVKRARLGAYQNRLEHTITNLSTAAANTVAAESRIRDADMAQEMMEFTKLNILGQAGNSMLAQANQLPQSMLLLMR